MKKTLHIQLILITAALASCHRPTRNGRMEITPMSVETARRPIPGRITIPPL